MGQTETISANDSFSLVTSEAGHGLRLDHFLVRHLGDVSRSQINAAIKSGAVAVNGAVSKSGCRLKEGDIVSGTVAVTSTAPEPIAQDVDFSILFEDDSMLVVDKPPGLVVHPGSGNRDKTLVNGLLSRYSEIAEVGDQERPGIVHRLDKDTSGVLVVARTRAAHRALTSSFKNRQVKKCYLALVHGSPREDMGQVMAPIGRHPVHRQKMAIRPGDGRDALSRWKVRCRFARHSLLEVEIETGRTHQIRVHMASIGHPVAGDRLYGPNRDNDRFERQLLHSWVLQIPHPETGRMMRFEAPLPQDFESHLSVLEAEGC